MLMGTSSGLTTMQSRVIRRASAPQLLNVVNPLDYHVLEESAFTYRELADGMYGSLSEDQLLLRQQLPPDRREPSSGGRPSERSPVPEHIAIDNLQSPAPQEGRRRMYPGTAAVKEPADDEQPEVSQVPLPAVSPFATAREPGTSSPEASVHRGRLQSTPEHPDDSAVSNSKTNLAVLTAIWPTVVALFLSGVFFTTVFPFFTYIPTSGRFGLLLPKVLFFVRLFCDVVGRMLPRFKPLSTSSPKVVLALGLVMTASLGFFFAYFQFPKQRLSDIGIAVYIGGTWVLGGYINTMCYTLAPQSVHAEHRAVANAYLAITFQTSHVFGLIFATFLIFLMFDASRAPSTIPN